MKDRQPFGVAGIWENWKLPGTEDWIRTFALITCPARLDSGSNQRPRFDGVVVVVAERIGD